MNDPIRDIPRLVFGLSKAGKLNDYVSVRDFIQSGDPNHDLAFQRAIENAVYTRRPLMIEGDFNVSRVSLVGIRSLHIDANAVLIADSNEWQPCLLEIGSCTDIKIHGALALNVGRRLKYECGVWIYATESGCQYIDLYSVSVAFAKLAWKIGKLAYPDATLSEINIFGGHTYNCPGVCELTGTNTVVNMHGVNWVSDVGSDLDEANHSAWTELPRFVVRSIGSYAYFHGGEALITNTDTGIVAETRPIKGVVLENRYGAIHFNGTTIETASPLGKAANPDSVPPDEDAAGTGVLSFFDCTGYNGGDSEAFITTEGDFKGLVEVCKCNFFCPLGVSRKHKNIIAKNDDATIRCDETSFRSDRLFPDRGGAGFLNWASGVQGGTLLFSHRKIFEASGLARQAFNSGVARFRNLNQTGELERWSGSYSTLTGEFTVPYGGLRDVTVMAGLIVVGVTDGELQVRVDGIQQQSGLFNRFGQVQATFKSLSAGQTIQIFLAVYSGNGTAIAAEHVHQFSIFASR